MKESIFKTVAMLEKIAGKYTGSEPTFNESIKKTCAVACHMIRFELLTDRSGLYSWDILRAAVVEILPELEKIGNMEQLKNFLQLPEIQIIKLYNN